MGWGKFKFKGLLEDLGNLCSVAFVDCSRIQLPRCRGQTGPPAALSSESTASLLTFHLQLTQHSPSHHLTINQPSPSFPFSSCLQLRPLWLVSWTVFVHICVQQVTDDYSEALCPHLECRLAKLWFQIWQDNVKFICSREWTAAAGESSWTTPQGAGSEIKYSSHAMYSWQYCRHWSWSGLMAVSYKKHPLCIATMAIISFKSWTHQFLVPGNW